MPAIRVNSPSSPYCSMRDAEAVLQAPGHCIAVDRSCRLHPGVDRVLMQRPELAVPVCPGGIEDHAVGMQLRVVVPAGSMLEHRCCDVSADSTSISPSRLRIRV